MKTEVPTGADDMPTMTCPKCKAEMPDFDGFGVLYHEACGFCRHASIDDGRCNFCKQVVRP